ncbi:hypothetical protein [Verrucomicrobium spinosum]|uniref:hypothetical protein n=1 Tax=Verrucomicrobium spinosum TaxID=2736 RepID=UPI0001745AA9|nr:hypothetical protein [Verrucomicrobium spinosum]
MPSFIYAGLTPEDPRVQEALQWLGEYYSVEENPGMGAEGLFYYYHTLGVPHHRIATPGCYVSRRWRGLPP